MCVVPSEVPPHLRGPRVTLSVRAFLHCPPAPASQALVVGDTTALTEGPEGSRAHRTWNPATSFKAILRLPSFYFIFPLFPLCRQGLQTPFSVYGAKR